ncbi:histidine-tRNA ligase [Reticulomyxa filosa]|uniref:Histidine-tRNA ligase n=1 Tax=Reticulomyxa filosa TaxID=46433 RepID=X6M682_RETFI|nr:histidine-tRNA ligase [Reticulomyxa filosa]|eukprot:ETO09404.1 histidine-tRNA ligase [Reticulomyxa filosa]
MVFITNAKKLELGANQRDSGKQKKKKKFDWVTKEVKKKCKTKKKKKEKESENEDEDEDTETSIRLKTPRGTRDYHPWEQRLRNEMMDTIKQNFEKNGGQYIETPVMELKSIMMNKYGEEEKLIYELQRQDGTAAEELCLRYDLTVPLARYVAMNRKRIKSPFKAARIGCVLCLYVYIDIHVR